MRKKTNNPIHNGESRAIYSPNSIHHGLLITENSCQDRLTLKINEAERLKDFIEFLFDHSEHCDHITQREAWKEFEIYEIKNSCYRERIRKQRAELRTPSNNSNS